MPTAVSRIPPIVAHAITSEVTFISSLPLLPASYYIKLNKALQQATADLMPRFE